MFLQEIAAAAPSAVHSITAEAPANIGASMAVVPILEWMKRQQWLGWVNDKTAPIIGVIAAAIVAAGIHLSYDQSTGTAIITGLTPAALMTMVFEISKQWLTQHWTYKVYQISDAQKSLAAAVFLQTGGRIETPSVTGATMATEGKK